MLFHAKKWLLWHFLEIFILSNFVTKLILQTWKSPRKHQQGGILQDSYSDETFL